MAELSIQEFLDRFRGLGDSFKAVMDLRRDAITTENIFRELFARQRESWEIPEVDDPFVFLVKVFSCRECFVKVPDFEEDTIPRCCAFKRGDDTKETLRIASGLPTVVKSLDDFIVSWECFTEGLLRFVDWNNVFAAGGSVAGCLAPLPTTIATANNASTRVQRRRYFHDTFLPGSDIDLFLYGLNETDAEAKLLEIYDAVQAASPYEIRAFRSAHAISLVSVYPYRHVQIVLRLYNSPSEILMGFDVDACAAGFDGNDVFVCPRTALAMVTQANTVDMTRRSPSYEMRLSKYAQRGFEVLVPGLDRERVDPFLYEKRFDQIKGLARLLMLERLRTPEERMRYRLQSQLKKSNEWQIRNKISKLAGDMRNIERMEGGESIIPNVSGPEVSDYSAVFLPWGPNWPVSKLERMTKKKDSMLNKVEFLPNGQVISSRRPYKLHVCAIGTMAEVIDDPFPSDPAIPHDVAPEALEGTVRGRVSWLIDNPGRQKIGSFHPITEDDWKEGAFISEETEKLIIATVANDCTEMKRLLDSDKVLATRDFLGRTALHVSVVAGSTDACRMLLAHPKADSDFLKARLADGRNALHLASIKGNLECVEMILTKVKELVDQNGDEIVQEDIFDIDGSDWDVKMNPLHYAILFGHLDIVRVLLAFGADARKAAVHKDRNESLSTFGLLSIFGAESGKQIDLAKVEETARLLLRHNATAAQVDTNGSTCWHRLASCPKPSNNQTLALLLKIHQEHDGGTPQGLNIINNKHQTPLYMAALTGNTDAVGALLTAGALPSFDIDIWDALLLKKRASGPDQGRYFTRVSSVEASALRSPIFLSAVAADKDTIAVFLKHCPGIVSSELSWPDYIARQVLPSAWIPDRERDQKVRVSLLDVVEALQWRLEKGSINLTQENYEKTVQPIKELEEKAKKELDSVLGSYKRRLLTMTCVQLSHRRKIAVSNLDPSRNSDETRLELDSAAQRLIDCAHLLTSHGGLTILERKTDVGPKASNPKPNCMRAKSNWFRIIGVAQFSALLGERHGYFYVYRLREIPECKRVDYEGFFEAILENKPVSTILQTSQGLQASVCDNMGSTPISLAVKNGAVETVRFLIVLAMEQFTAHLEGLRQRRQAEDDIRTGTLDQSENLLKDQLRRINNIDIASGSKVGNTVPTPDLMRERLSAAETAALLQTSSLEETKEATITSDVPIDRILLFRTIFLGEDDTSFIALKQRLSTMNPGLFPADYMIHPMRLRPIEVAVIRKDLLMLELVQEQLFSAAKAACSVPATHESTEEECDSENESDSENECGASDMESAQTGSLSVEELRYLTYGEGSRNPDLGGITLIQLAILMDETSMLCAIAPFAREQMIPRFAVAAWRDAIANGEDYELDSDVKKKKDDITEGDDINMSRGPLWMTDNPMRIQNNRRLDIPLHPTMLQVALAFQSASIIQSLLFGDWRESLFSWARDEVLPDLRIGKRSYPYTVLDGALVALNCLIQCTKGSPEIRLKQISQRLCGVDSVDAAGRSALFYGQPHLISKLVQLEVTQTNVPLVGMSMTGGAVTPLIAYACSGSFDGVKALLECGADVSQASGERCWNVIHYLIDSTQILEKRSSEDEWDATRKMIDFLIANSEQNAIAAAFLCPDAEHTPLMVAANKSASPEFIAFLLAKYGTLALDGLERTDSELNSVLHQVVRNSLRRREDTGVSLLLNLEKRPNILGPSVENSDGVTPSEIALQEISSPWVRGALPTDTSATRYARTLKIPKDLSKLKIDPEISFQRQLLQELYKCRQGRFPASFMAVKQAKSRTTKNKDKAGGCSSSSDLFSKPPSGPPSVLMAYQPIRRTAMNDANAPTDWQGWFEQY